MMRGGEKSDPATVATGRKRPGHQSTLPEAAVARVRARSCQPQSGVPAAPPDGNEANEAGAEERDGRRLGHCGRKFGNHDLAVAGLEIGDQDLLCARIKGATTTTGTSTGGAARAAATTAVSATTASAGAAAPAAAEATTKRASCQIRECTSAGAAEGSVAAGTKKTAAATATTEENAAGTPVAAGAASAAATRTEATAVRTGEPALARLGRGPGNAAATAAAGDDQRHVARPDHETSAAATTTAATTAAAGDLQYLPCSKAEIAADLSPSTAYTE
jgi:hypothetical protein